MAAKPDDMGWLCGTRFTESESELTLHYPLNTTLDFSYNFLMIVCCFKCLLSTKVLGIMPISYAFFM